MCDMHKRASCRLCKSTDVVKFLELGKMPLAGAFITEGQMASEKFYPLDVYFCKNCTLVQLMDVVPKDILFKEYFYLSSVSLKEYFSAYAKHLVEKILPAGSFAVEIGSNDGVLLKPLKQLGIKVLGIEPAANVAEIAEQAGVETINDFFTREIAARIVKEKGKADAVLANNVFAHIDDLDEVVEAVKLLLKENGIFIFEVHYLLDLIEKLQYDTVYHEHLCYYSIGALIPFFRHFGMEIYNVERIPTHAGSIRVYVRNVSVKPTSPNVNNLLEMEKAKNLHSLETYQKFAVNVKNHKEELVRLLKQLKSDGKKIIGYGAAGRGNTLLNYCKIGPDILEFIVDDSPARQGRLTPGMHIPIVPREKIEITKPDYVLMLAWSYKEQIMEKEQDFINKGGKFIIPLPKPVIIT